MAVQIIGLRDWFDTSPGCYLLQWEQRQWDALVADVFGYHALQLGFPLVEALQANRMPHRWLAQEQQSGISYMQTLRNVDVQFDFGAMPFPSSCIDLMALPHTLEFTQDPRATLREVHRVLVPEGKVVITGLNPWSLWGLRQQRCRLYNRLGASTGFLPQSGSFIGYWRLRDWLHVLGFDVEEGGFGCYRPALTSEKWLHRFSWMDTVGARYWPLLGAAYYVVAVKRVRGMRLLESRWSHTTSAATRPAVIASSQNHQNFTNE